MFKLFRKIRYNLMSENKTSKYLKYAIGEIILVVIGILIALQINNWNENRKEQKIERNYVELLIQDLKEDAIKLAELIEDSDKSVESKAIMLDYLNGNTIQPDSLSTHFLRAVFSGVQIFVPNKGVIEEVQNAGGLSLIKDEDVRNQILKLYNAYDRIDKNVGDKYLRSRLTMRDLVYANAHGKLFLTHDQIDLNLLEHLITNNELRNRLINNYAVSYNVGLKELLEQNRETKQICENYLKFLKE